MVVEVVGAMLALAASHEYAAVVRSGFRPIAQLTRRYLAETRPVLAIHTFSRFINQSTKAYLFKEGEYIVMLPCLLELIS